MLASPILRKMDRYNLIRNALEIKGYADPVGGGRTKIRIKLHGPTSAILR
jgi:hypothetical protein